MNKTVMKNLNVNIGDFVTIQPIKKLRTLTKIHILPFADTIQGFKGNLIKKFLEPYFQNAYRPVMKNNFFNVIGFYREIKFQIISCEPEDYGIVGPKTILCAKGQPIKKESFNINSKFKFQVQNAKHDDNSAVFIHPDKMEKLDIFKGDIVMLRSNKGKQCPLLAMQDEELDFKIIGINQIVRKNLNVDIFDIVSIKQVPQQMYLTKIHILPFADTIQGFKGKLFQKYIEPYFSNAYRPVMKNNFFIVKKKFRDVEFKIMECQPQQWGIVTPKTILCAKGKPIIRQIKENNTINQFKINKNI